MIDGNFMNIPLPKKLRTKNIKLIDIKVINDRFKIFLSYEEPNDPEPINIKKYSLRENIGNSISIDTGIENLLTIYNPTGYQRIFKGNTLVSINNFYNKKINKLKSINKKLYDKNKFKRLNSLLEERKNKLYAHINKIVDSLVETYKNKYIFILGYNKRWKNKVNLGRDTNRKFYQIPYAYIIEKLKSKLTSLGKILIINEESYTSKCDALTLEKICKHKKYSGKRIKRGLFKSGNGKVINADLNGAINIMRKSLYKLHPEEKKCDLTSISGSYLYNPEIVKFRKPRVYFPVK
jgi:IS605 OrfB family transposase